MSTPINPADPVEATEQTLQPIGQLNNDNNAVNNSNDRNSTSFVSIRVNWRENLSSNISNMLQEFRPVFEPSRTYRSNPNESFVINLDNSQISEDSPNSIQNDQAAVPNMIINTQNETNDSTNESNNLTDALASIPDTATRYLPYICILLTKSCYDHIDGILDFFALFVTFLHSNKVQRLSLFSLF